MASTPIVGLTASFRRAAISLTLYLPIVLHMEARVVGIGGRVAGVRGVLVPSARQMARRRVCERIWIVLGVLWAVGRVFVAKATVERYGVNISVFAVLEILVAWPHALGAARVVTKLVDRDPHGALRWGTLLAVTHIAPELYIAVAGSHMPFGVYVSLALIVVGLGALGVVGIVQKVGIARVERELLI